MPFEHNLIDECLLTNDHVDWLNYYYQGIRDKVTPLLKDQAVRDFLMKKTTPFKYSYENSNCGNEPSVSVSTTSTTSSVVVTGSSSSSSSRASVSVSSVSTSSSRGPTITSTLPQNAATQISLPKIYFSIFFVLLVAIKRLFE